MFSVSRLDVITSQAGLEGSFFFFLSAGFRHQNYDATIVFRPLKKNYNSRSQSRRRDFRYWYVVSRDSLVRAPRQSRS